MKNLTLDALNFALIICIVNIFHDACGGYVFMSLPLTRASPLPGKSAENHVPCKRSHWKLKKKKKTLLLSRCIFLTLPSHTYLHMCVLKIKSILSHHMAFLQERNTEKRQVKDENYKGENRLKAKLKCLLQSYSLGCEWLYGRGSCWRSSASFVVLQHWSHGSEGVLLCCPVKQEPRFNLHSDSVGTLEAGGRK